MSAEEGNANQGLYGEEDMHDTEDDVESGTTKGSSSNSSAGTNHQQQDQINSDMSNMARAMAPPMLQKPHAVAGPSNAQFPGAQHQQQLIATLPSTPLPATPHSVVPATMDLLPVLQHHGQNMSPAPYNQLVISQQNAMHNEQFHMPANQTIQSIRAPYTAIMSSTYSHSSSNMPADYGFNASPRAQMPIGNIPNFMEHLLHVQRGYQQMVHNPSFTLYGPPQPNLLQAAAYPAGGPPLPYHPLLMPTISDPQMRVVPDDQPLSWAPPAHGNQNQQADRPGTSAPRCTNSLYDPSYAAMGLPIDPHLRMFLASLNQEKDTDNQNNGPK